MIFVQYDDVIDRYDWWTDGYEGVIPKFPAFFHDCSNKIFIYDVTNLKKLTIFFDSIRKYSEKDP